MLEKDDAYFLDPALGLSMTEAKAAATSDKKKPCQLIRLIHSKQQRKREMEFADSRVEKQQFINLIKLVKEVQISDSIISDMFLTFAKKLGQPAPVQKPAAKDPKLGNTLGKS